MATTSDFSYLDYFIGGVPPGPLFSINLDDVEGVLRSTTKPPLGRLDPAAELCFIGQVAYFEAFFRHHVASLINICPNLVGQLKTKGREVSVDAAHLLDFAEHPKSHLGSLLAEKYELGTPKSANALYTDLLMVTPFSKDEAAQYSKVLNDRNLLVHHGGIYTTRYVGQTFVKRRVRQRTFLDSLVIRRQDVRSTASFFTGVAKKTLKASQDALKRYVAINRIRISARQRKAIDSLLW